MLKHTILVVSNEKAWCPVVWKFFGTRFGSLLAGPSRHVIEMPYNDDVINMNLRLVNTLQKVWRCTCRMNKTKSSAINFIPYGICTDVGYTVKEKRNVVGDEMETEMEREERKRKMEIGRRRWR